MIRIARVGYWFGMKCHTVTVYVPDVSEMVTAASSDERSHR